MIRLVVKTGFLCLILAKFTYEKVLITDLILHLRLRKMHIPSLLIVHRISVTGLTSTYWKHIPTMKLAVQLVKPATAMAEGRGPCEKSSATMNHGMGPGPISKNATKAKMDTMLKYDIHLSWSCQSRGGRGESCSTF